MKNKGKLTGLLAEILAAIALILYLLMQSMYFSTYAAIALTAGIALMAIATSASFMPAAVIGYGGWLYALYEFLKYEVDLRMDNFVVGDFLTGNALFWSVTGTLLLAIIFGIIASVRMAAKASK